MYDHLVVEVASFHYFFQFRSPSWYDPKENRPHGMPQKRVHHVQRGRAQGWLRALYTWNCCCVHKGQINKIPQRKQTSNNYQVTLHTIHVLAEQWTSSIIYRNIFWEAMSAFTLDISWHISRHTWILVNAQNDHQIMGIIFCVKQKSEYSFTPEKKKKL